MQMRVCCTANYKPPTVLGTECNKIQPVEMCYNMQQVSSGAFVVVVVVVSF